MATDNAQILNVLLKTHQDPEDIDFTDVWEHGVFVFDANVLLDLYRLPKPASQELIGVLRSDRLKDRIWLPFQALLEFLNNRHDTVGDQKNKFNTVRALLERAGAEYDQVFMNLFDALAKQRHSLIDPDKFVTRETAGQGKAQIEAFLSELSVLEGQQSDVNDRDEIRDVVLEVFAGRIGNAFGKKELAEIYKAGEKRYENEVPPGYMGKSKKGAYLVWDLEFVRKYGDLLLWREVVEKTKLENLKSVVLGGPTLMGFLPLFGF